MTFQCAFCGDPINPGSRFTWRRITGWERKGQAETRKSGSDIALREPRDEYACNACIASRKGGVARGQEELLVRRGLASPGPARRDQARHGAARPDMARPGSARPGGTWPGPARPGPVRLGAAWRSRSWRVGARRGPDGARPAMTRPGLARLNNTSGNQPDSLNQPRKPGHRKEG